MVKLYFCISDYFMAKLSTNVCDDEQYNTLKNRVSSLLKQAGKFYNKSFPPPTIFMDILGADAGQALPERNILRFNLVFFANGYAHYLEQIVAHEVAHLVAFHIFGKRIRPHGKEWEEVMVKIFGLPALRCHSYDLSTTGRYPYIYNCGCSDKKNFFSTTRHRRACKGIIYMCRSCGDKLQYSHQIKQINSENSANLTRCR